MDQAENDTSPSTPTAAEMLTRLRAVDTGIFDIKSLADQLKGKHAWIFVLTMPVSAIFLVTVTLLGTFLTGYFVASFLVAALLLFIVGKMLDQFEKRFFYQARITVMQRIQETEGDYGLIPHFKDFLPAKYRHLWQSLRKGRYQYIDQYIAAITLLQHKLEDDKFTRIWEIRHPELASDEDEDEV
ncbi:hypothetical protein [Thiosulfativibrio zosterae]|uniref:Uncharacterized protein n=1 Tax=Thiosulfativibrio zosterae TaxID=2675053 RepID=A0A6F8PLP3_9GAMM|nr:hypothetical protein [Thiosulfativibrio zosterae]BBP43006.1 hypothetical protein THMIRHAT_07520 [Thiosulfativibrio zosterae]